MELDNRHSLLQNGLASLLQYNLYYETIQIDLVHIDGRMRLLRHRLHLYFHDAVQTARSIMEPHARTLQADSTRGVCRRQC